MDNGITIGFTVGDVTSAVAEMRAKNIPILRDVIEHDAGKNAIIQDPDGYLVSFFEPAFKDAAQQTGGYHGCSQLVCFVYFIKCHKYLPL